MNNDKDDRPANEDYCPFERARLSTLDPSEALDRFLTHGFLWVQHDKATDNSNKTDNPLSDFFATHAKACQDHWSLENLGNVPHESAVGPTALAGKPHDDDDLSNHEYYYYASTIISKQQTTALQDLLQHVPLFEVFESEDYCITGGAWIFCASLAAANKKVAQTTNNKKKRSRPIVLAGRAEHVDQVPHSGTFHYQLRGSKTWLLRPHVERFAASTKEMPDLSASSQRKSKLASVAEQIHATGAWRLRINVQQGDWLILDTKIWYHCTEIESNNNNNHHDASRSPWSISVARDFYLAVHCPHDAQQGQVLLEGSDIPEDMPRTTDVEKVNCALAEVANDESPQDEDDDDDEEEDETLLVLIATREIKEGELLYIQVGNENAENDIDNHNNVGEYNANETVDPRAVASKDYGKGDIVLQCDDIPNDLPRSNEPNCALEQCSDAGGIIVLKAIRNILKTEVLCILPDQDEEYEEVEVDLDTGDMTRIK